MRRVVYPLPEGAIKDETADAIRAALRNGAKALAEGASPMFQQIPGFPDPSQGRSEPRIQHPRAARRALGVPGARARRRGSTREPQQRRDLALALRDDYPAGGTISQAAALEVAALLRDCVGWKESIEYVDALPASIRELDLLQEQRCLAQSKTGDHRAAIAALEELVAGAATARSVRA